jgi:O-antigen/teichoic acid export membrane protein
VSAETAPKRRSLAVNSLFSAMAWLLPIVIGFVATPILVRNLGSTEYGIFAIVLGFISYSFTFGIGKVAGKYVPEFQAAGEPEKVTQVISATFWFSLLIGSVGAIGLALCSSFLVTDVLLVSTDLRETAVYALYLAGMIGLVTMLSQVFQFVLQGLHRFDNYAALTNLSSLLVGVGNIVLAKNGYSVVGLLVWNCAITAAIAVLFYIRAKHLLPTIKLASSFPRDLVSTVVRYGGSIILYQIFANVLFIFERSWVMRKFGPDTLTFYFVPMLLAIYMHGFVSSVVQALFPVVNEILDNRERVINLYRRANKIVLAIVVFSVTNFVVCGALFLRLWVNPELAAESYRLLIPHGLTFGTIALGILAFQLTEAYRFPALNVIMTGAWMAIAIPLMIISADRWHSEGVAWSRFIAAAIVAVPMIAYTEHRALGNVQTGFWLASAVKVAVAATAMAGVDLLILNIAPGSYATLFVLAIAGSAVFAGGLLLTGFVSHEDRSRLQRYLMRAPVV